MTVTQKRDILVYVPQAAVPSEHYPFHGVSTETMFYKEQLTQVHDLRFRNYTNILDESSPYRVGFKSMVLAAHGGYSFCFNIHIQHCMH